MGRHTLVKTDHSPLEQIFKKNVARFQRMLLRCLKYDIEVKNNYRIKITVTDAYQEYVCHLKAAQNVKSTKSATSMVSNAQSTLTKSRKQ